MASDFWLIAGLGNPGKKYEDTRHNMGFMTADVLAERWSVNFADHKGLAMLGKSTMNLDGRTIKFFLAKPLTYMNDSGNAVASISAYYQIEPDHIVVIHDDMDLEFGRWRRCGRRNHLPRSCQDPGEVQWPLRRKLPTRSLPVDKRQTAGPCIRI